MEVVCSLLIANEANLNHLIYSPIILFDGVKLRKGTSLLKFRRVTKYNYKVKNTSLIYRLTQDQIIFKL